MSEEETTRAQQAEDEHWQRAWASPDGSLREGYWVFRACLRWHYDYYIRGVQG